jgi:hypothetical protein
MIFCGIENILSKNPDVVTAVKIEFNSNEDE